MRRLIRGMPYMLLATLLLFARLVAPAAAMPSPADAVEQIALHTLCHDATPDGPAKTPAHHDCLLCPACHLHATVAIPAPDGPAISRPTLSLIGLAAPMPPATGPPSPVRLAFPPTGPPSLSV